jgi:hypothetical protein
MVLIKRNKEIKQIFNRPGPLLDRVFKGPNGPGGAVEA